MIKKDKMGNRSYRDQFRKRVPDLGYYFIATDAEATEENYFYGLRDSLPDNMKGRIVIKVIHARTAKLVQKCKEQAAMEPQYAEPWIVFDRDQVVDFDGIIEAAHREGVKTGWSNPCIEIWFDAYFGMIHNYSDSVACCKGFANTYRRYTGYEYSKSNMHIYEILNRYGSEETAIKLADRRFHDHIRTGRSKPSEMITCTTIYSLVNEIKRKQRYL